MKSNILLVVILSIWHTSTSFAQNYPSQELQKFVDKKMEKSGIQMTKTHQLKAKDYDAPQKIGVLVFYVDARTDVTNSGGMIRKVTISKVAATAAAQEIYTNSIESIKASYASQGVELLAPNEYLNTDAKREAFESMDMRVLGMGGAAYVKPDQVGLPTGYRYFTNSSQADIGGRADIAEELKMFGMDGYLSVIVTVRGENSIRQISTNLILLKDKDYVSKIKKETFRRSDIAAKMLPIGTTQILASERQKLESNRMIQFDDGKVWVDPNVAKVIIYSASLYFPMVK